MYPFYTKPYIHQKKALLAALKKGSIAFLMDPGSGKTKPSIDYFGIRNYMNQCDRVLIIAPKTVLGVWEEEIETHLHPEIKRKVIRLEGPKRSKVLADHKKTKGLIIYLISYDSTWRTRSLATLVKPDMIICDESHYISNPTSTRSRFIRKLSTVAKWKLILTGTFLPNGVLGAYSQMSFLDKSIFPMSWSEFKERFMVWYKPKGKYFKIPKRPKRTKELNRIINRNAFIVKKEDVLKLPKRTDVYVPVEMSAKGWKYYNQMKKDKLIKFKNSKARADIILTELLHFQQITGGFVRTETGEYDKNDRPIKKDIAIHADKLKALNELLDIHMAYGEKILVFCQFTWEFDQISNLMKKKKMRYAGISGKSKHRDEVRRGFQRGDYDALVIQIATGGVGITLTAANIVIFYSLNQRLDHYIQAKDRVHRPGQKKPVTYYHLIVRKTIDDAIIESHKNKSNLAEMVTNKNWEDFI